MGALLDDLLRFQEDDECMRGLATSCGLSVGEASATYQVAAPMAIEGLADCAAAPARARSLLHTARSLRWKERNEPERLFLSLDHTLGEELMRRVFGGSLSSVTSSLATEAGIAEGSATSLLEVATTAALALVVGPHEGELDVDALTTPLEAERNDLSATSRAGGKGVVAESSTVETSIDGEFAAEEAADEYDEEEAADDLDSDEIGTADKVEVERHTKKETVAEKPTSGSPAAETTAPRSSKNVDLSEPVRLGANDEGSKKGLLVGAVVGVIALLGIGGFVLFAGGSSSDSDDDEAAATETTETTVDETDTEASDGDDTSTAGSDELALADEAGTDGEIVSLSIPMQDITDPDRGASGVLSFDFNTKTGEVCYSVSSTNIQGPYRSHIHVGGFGVKGGIVVDLGPLESGGVGCVSNLPIDTNAILADRSGHYAELHDISEEWTIRGQLSETIEGDVVSINVPMTDVELVNPSAEGVLAFDFNTASGEVCYRVTSSNIEGPYRSHIHVGGDGEKGGIVVDLGPLESGGVGCVSNLPIDTNAILADRSGHYAELHDISEEWTIRGQLSQTVVDGGDATAIVDTDGGGARTVLEGGTITLEGEVPDQATADELLASFAGVSNDTPVVDNLTVVEGAPLPSGRIVIVDTIFFEVNSDQVKAIDDRTLGAITALAKSREDWILTVVGHTDSDGSDVSNLELSLRRATALRDLLAAQGLAEENLRIRGAGETAPIADNATVEGRAQNRRIEFEFTPTR